MESRKTNDARTPLETSMPRTDSYYASEYNGACGANGRPSLGNENEKGDTEDASRSRWGLRGYNPPAHLRLDGYAYDEAEDSFSARVRMSKIVPRTIDEREVAYGEDYSGGLDEEDGVGAGGLALEAEDARGARRVSGGMSSRPSWGPNAYAGSCAV
jgi:hypothetical protein